MGGPIDDPVRGIGTKRRAVEKLVVSSHNNRVASVAGKKLNKLWADRFVQAGYKYVFTEVPIQGWEHVRPGGFPGQPAKPKAWRLAKWVPEADVVFGDSLDDLHWFDSKKEPTTSLSKAQKMTYPKINENGGMINWESKRNSGKNPQRVATNLVDGKPVNLEGRNIRPGRGHVGHSVDLSAVGSGQRDLTEMLAERRGQLKPAPTPFLALEDSRLITDGDRGLAREPSGGPPSSPPSSHPHAQPSLVPKPHASTLAHVAEGGVHLAERGMKARALLIGAKAWRAARAIGKVLVLCIVPLTALDVALEVAMHLWDRKREKEARKRRDKQSSLEAVFKQGAATIEKGVQAINSTASSVQGFMDSWEKNRRFLGFRYARLSARLSIESYQPLFGEEAIESLTTYKVVSLTVQGIDWVPDFELEDIGEAKELEKSKEDLVALFDKGQMNPNALRKMSRQRTLRYTIVPPVLTPFDIVVVKLNNLFLDVARFIAWFSGSEESALEGVSFLNFTYGWDEQLALLLQYPAPLNAEVCKYCLAYIYAAAKQMSRHPLEQQDLAGNLEDPTRGWQRRFWLLMWLLDGSGSRYGKNFSQFAAQLKKMVRPGHGDPEIAAALESLYEGARTIWYDIERIEKNLYKPEYYYFGPQYDPGG